MAGRPLVLMYHAVDTRPAEDDPDNLFVPAPVFARQLDLLAARGLRPCSLQEHLAGTAGSDRVLLTFDDAYTSTLTHAAPLLAERGWPAVVFAASRRLGGRSDWNHCSQERLLDVDGLRELQRLGFEVGAHSRTHPDLTGLSAAELDREVRGSGEELGELLGQRPRAFAHPFGAHDPQVRAATERAGYAVAFATHAGAGRFALPRVDVNAADTERTFRLKLWRGYPAVRRSLGVSPPVRRAVHRLVGSAAR